LTLRVSGHILAAMRNAAAASLVFIGGFIIMVVEIIGARFLAKDFGSSFHVWVSQIGVVLIALAAGYYGGGALADRWQRLSLLAILLLPTGILLFLIPSLGAQLIDAIIARHPMDRPIPAIWQKLDPVLGSALIFLLPCVVLATLSPYMIRLATQSLEQVGRASGFIIAASTVGSIAGVFVSGFVLIEYMKLSEIFRVMGAMTVLLGVACFALDRWFAPASNPGERKED
jgi:predicted MFS family arabinose efflux permease